MKQELRKPTNSLTLISHHLCPYVQRAAIALMEKEVPFERVYVDLANKPDWFNAISPLGKVPLLRVGQPGQPDIVLFESNVICEYLEETQSGPALHPADPLKRAQRRAWMEFGSAVLGDIWGLETAKDRESFEAKRVTLTAKFAQLESAMSAGPYFGGADFSLVDAVFGPIFRYFDLFDTLLDTQVMAKTPRVRRWRSGLASRLSVVRAVESDYVERLRNFLEIHDAYILHAAA